MALYCRCYNWVLSTVTTERCFSFYLNSHSAKKPSATLPRPSAARASSNFCILQSVASTNLCPFQEISSARQILQDEDELLAFSAGSPSQLQRFTWPMGFKIADRLPRAFCKRTFHKFPSQASEIRTASCALLLMLAIPPNSARTSIQARKTRIAVFCTT